MGSSLRKALVVLGHALVLLVVATAAVWLSVRITPLQSVSAAGQTVQVGAVPPDGGLSGPGELDLFGQKIATRPHFDGPIRPRLKLTRITFDAEAAQLLRSGRGHAALSQVGGDLAAGWWRYAVWETAVSAGLMLLVVAAATGIRRTPPRRTVVLLGTGLVTVIAVNAVGFSLLAAGTPRVLHEVRTLDDLVGREPPSPVRPAAGPALPGVRAVVLGDSTAAGTGNRAMPGGDALDKACGRSRDAFARKLAEVNGWDVLNLACSGATVRDGVLGTQQLSGRSAPAQLAVAQRAAGASVVTLSIGANDVRWQDLVRLCAAAPVCDDRATHAYFRDLLSRFTLDYQELLRHLAALPQHPRVLVNEYYDPFGRTVDCLKKEGLTLQKAQVLRARLTELNTVLRQGALASGFTAVRPDFTGHELCSKDPFVQGPTARAPLHPTAAGELVIALANQQALTRPPGRATPS
ncbi:SGNH/GDSL hydrolase family protein [Streptomyces sp. NPDC046261]|uniref:SGNH/GDSL hydrolase family protein n=1 Tax=Streptomyces sp. NPDC046261 TaxID=3157200 RepID=UPI0033F31E9B